MSKKHLALVNFAELLAVSTGKVKGEPKVILTFRLQDGDDIEVTNMAISPQQAQRLITDLTARFQNSKVLAAVRPLPDDGKQVFDRIMSREPDASSTEQLEGQ
jgi:hypothetical protein